MARGVVPVRQVIIQNLTPPGTAEDLKIINQAGDRRVQAGVSTSGNGIVAIHGALGNTSSFGSELGPEMIMVRDETLFQRIRGGVVDGHGSWTVYSIEGSLVHIGSEPVETMIVARNSTLESRFQAGIDISGNGKATLTGSADHTLVLNGGGGGEAIAYLNPSGSTRVELGMSGDAGRLFLDGAAGSGVDALLTTAIGGAARLDLSGGGGDVELRSGAGAALEGLTSGVEILGSKHITPFTSNTFDLGSDAARYRDLHLGGVVNVDGVQVLAGQQAAVADVTNTADLTYSANERDMINELKDQVNALLARLRAHGIISS